MAELSGTFERDLREAVMDDAEDRLYAGRDNLAFAFLQFANDNLRDYGRSQGYEGMGNIAETGNVTDTRRTRDRVEATLEWDHPAAIFEFGASPHPIRGNPLLHFYWDAIDQWVQTEEVQWGSRTGGIPASRFLRGAIRRWGLEVQRGVTF